MIRNKKIILFLIVEIFVLSITIITQYDKSSNLQIDTKNYLSIMVKNDEGTYKVMNTIPTEGYVLNKTKSNCEGGSELKWQNGKLQITTNKTDTCHIYLEKEACKENETIENCLKRKDINSTLLFHNGSIEDTEGNIIDAEDLSYRYSGGNDVVNNYVCFGGDCSSNPTNENYANLYRIIGLFPTDKEHNTYQMKIIKADYATGNYLGQSGAYIGSNKYYHWNGNGGINNWEESDLYKDNLKGFYLDNYLQPIDNGKWYNMIEEHTWIFAGDEASKIKDNKVKFIYENENIHSDSATEVTAKVGLIYVSDYGYGAYKEAWYTITLGNYNEVKENNWLYMNNNESEWMIIPTFPHLYGAFGVSGYGNVNDYNIINYNDGVVRPVFYLKPSVKIISGFGTSVDPYILDM